jgi:hypothetical protein
MDAWVQLTRGERIVMILWVAVIALLAVADTVVLLLGDVTTRSAAAGLLVVTLVVAAIPVSPILRARIRRRSAWG